MVVFLSRWLGKKCDLDQKKIELIVLPGANKIARITSDFKRIKYLTIIPRARMGYESIAHEAEGRMCY